MQEAEFSMTENAFRDIPYQRGDESVFVQFYIHPKENKAKSLEAGRLVCDDTEFVRIMTPGDKDNIIERPAYREDRERFPRQYMAFKQGLTDPSVSGTPLKIWPGVTRSQAEELAYLKIFTVEQLAALSDSNAQGHGGIVTLRQKAQDFIAAAKDTAYIGQMRAELEQRDAKIADQERVIGEMTERLNRLESKILGE